LAANKAHGGANAKCVSMSHKDAYEVPCQHCRDAGEANLQICDSTLKSQQWKMAPIMLHPDSEGIGRDNEIGKMSCAGAKVVRGLFEIDRKE